MKKILLIAILLLIFPVSAHAHSGLASSTPAEGETLEGSPAEIRFQFESPIQQGDISVTDESGNAVEISDISFSEMELIGQLGEELPNGAYIADWSALSQDGHEITGTLTFNVQAEMTEEVADEQSTDAEAGEEQASEETSDATKKEEEASSTTDKQAEQATASTDQPAGPVFSVMTILIIAILAIAAIAFIVVARRK